MIWSLRYHNRDGGFYWHSNLGGGVFKAYHYPGFATGAAYEGALWKLRAKAYEISGLPQPSLAAPAAPTLLPIKSAADISWQGSVGATSYDVERAPAVSGPWTMAGMGVDDTWMQYRGLFSDAGAETGTSYYYRVLAKNAAGVSPVKCVGPVRVDDQLTVDELSDFSHSFAHGGGLTLETANASTKKTLTVCAVAGVGSVTARVNRTLREFWFHGGRRVI